MQSDLRRCCPSDVVWRPAFVLRRVAQHVAACKSFSLPVGPISSLVDGWRLPKGGWKEGGTGGGGTRCRRHPSTRQRRQQPTGMAAAYSHGDCLPGGPWKGRRGERNCRRSFASTRLALTARRAVHQHANRQKNQTTKHTTPCTKRANHNTHRTIPKANTQHKIRRQGPR